MEITTIKSKNRLRAVRVLAEVARSEGAAGGRIRVFVPYTTPGVARAGLAAAVALTEKLRAEITLFAVRAVPFPLPLDRPDVPAAWLERQLAGLASETGSQVEVRIVLVRDQDTGLNQILEPKSLVVMARRNRWWPTVERRLARTLARAGHNVITVKV